MSSSVVSFRFDSFKADVGYHDDHHVPVDVGVQYGRYSHDPTHR